MLVAVVEDDEDIALVISAIVEGAGHKVCTYNSARAFLNEIDRWTFDAILCDISMPEMDGIELRERMLQGRLQLAAGFIFITARQSSDHRVRAWNVQADGYLNKPFVAAELLALLNNVTRRRQLFQADLYQDTLTGLLNRRYFDDKLAAAFHGEKAQLVLIDLDNFKLYNDTYGHPEGDRCLRRVADLMRNAFGEDAHIMRMGGEEFLVVKRCGPAEIQDMCADLQRRLSAANIEHSGSQAGVMTLSGGLLLNAAFSKGNLETLYKKVDQLLYQAKNAGRNRFETGTA